MHVYYCKKCKQDSASPICEHCGMQIASLRQNERFKWCHIRTPLGDTPTLLGALKLLALSVIGLLLAIFLGELIVSPDKKNAMMIISASGLLPWSLILFAVCAAVILLVLGLRGQEELHFVQDSRGAHLQVWISPTRIKCLTRFVAFDRYNLSQAPDGNLRMLVDEQHLLWNDVSRCEIRRHAGRIDLYRPGSFRFMSLYPEVEEMQSIEAYLQQNMKHLAR